MNNVIFWCFFCFTLICVSTLYISSRYGNCPTDKSQSHCMWMVKVNPLFIELPEQKYLNNFPITHRSAPQRVTRSLCLITGVHSKEKQCPPFLPVHLAVLYLAWVGHGKPRTSISSASVSQYRPRAASSQGTPLPTSIRLAWESVCVVCVLVSSFPSLLHSLALFSPLFSFVPCIDYNSPRNS